MDSEIDEQMSEVDKTRTETPRKMGRMSIGTSSGDKSKSNRDKRKSSVI
jgi:hypothetical protein